MKGKRRKRKEAFPLHSYPQLFLRINPTKLIHCLLENRNCLPCSTCSTGSGEARFPRDQEIRLKIEREARRRDESGVESTLVPKQPARRMGGSEETVEMRERDRSIRRTSAPLGIETVMTLPVLQLVSCFAPVSLLLFLAPACVRLVAFVHLFWSLRCQRPGLLLLFPPQQNHPTFSLSLSRIIFQPPPPPFLLLLLLRLLLRVLPSRPLSFSFFFSCTRSPVVAHRSSALFFARGSR